MQWGLLFMWIIFTFFIILFYFASMVNLTIYVVNVSYYEGYENVKITLKIKNNGYNFILPQTTIKINKFYNFTLDTLLPPKEEVYKTIVLPYNGSLEIKNIEIEEKIDIYSSMWYIIQHLPSILVSELHLNIY